MPSITINCWDLPHYYGQFFVWLRFDVHLRIIAVYVNYKIQSMTALSHYLAHDTAWHEIRLCNTCYVTPSNWPHPSWPARLMWKWFYLWSPVQDSSYIYSEIAALPVSGSMSGVWRNTISEIYKYIILHSSPRYDENFSQSISDTLGKSFCQKQCASIATNQPPNFPVTSLLTWTWVFKEEWKFLPGDLPVDSQTIYSYGRPIMEMFHTLPSINGVSTKFSSRQLPGRLFQLSGWGRRFCTGKANGGGGGGPINVWPHVRSHLTFSPLSVVLYSPLSTTHFCSAAKIAFFWCFSFHWEVHHWINYVTVTFGILKMNQIW